MHIPARPNGKYYYELTYGGSGDGRINVAYIPADDYKRGEAYVAGKPCKDFDFYFVVITKPKGDRKANLERFFSNFDFSYPPLKEAGKAYEKGDYELAGKLILKHFENRTQPDVLVKPIEIKPDFDTRRMDLLTDRNLLRGEDGEGNRAFMRLDEYYTWREVWPNTAEYVRMNDIFWYLGLAYNATGNEKYAKKLNDLMIDYMQDNASPYDGGMRGGRWVAMFQAWRLGDAWDGWGLAFKSKSLQDDVKLAWLDYWCRMAHFAQNDHSGGNHANAVGQALISFSKRFPEFKRSKEWFNFGFDKLVNNSLVLFREDGGCVEPAMNYHGFSLGNLISGVNLVKEVGVEVPEHINKVIEKALVYTSYMLDPSGQAPALGDSKRR